MCDAADKPTGVEIHVGDRNERGHRRILFSGTPNVRTQLEQFGEVPLPHYIHRETGPTPEDRERYQTVFAEPAGSIAAPTAGLHFTNGMLETIRKALEVCFVTLHVGPGTFVPVKAELLEEHSMHEERYELSENAAQCINKAQAEGRRIVAVGTTTVRVLESIAAVHDGKLIAGAGRTRLFVYPPRSFQVVGAMLTNFHLPKSTLFMLVSAFAAPGETRGIDLVRSAYAEAIRERYRFFSYGDAMLIE
jgi:S-adenosylmethionine:tRNA ribosyltransferase-isomerase